MSGRTEENAVGLADLAVEYETIDVDSLWANRRFIFYCAVRYPLPKSAPQTSWRCTIPKASPQCRRIRLDKKELAMPRIKQPAAKRCAYTVHIEPAEGGGYVVTVPALPGCVTQGETYAEAVAMAQEVIEGFIEALTKLQP